MIDREKVIKGIRKCLSHKPCGENGCPYEDECAVEHLNDPLLRDALTLLKEQEPVEPLYGSHGERRCGVCRNKFFVYKQLFCASCGRAAKWE